MAGTVAKKEPERPTGSPRTEVPSHRRPLGLWCPKQPPRRRVSTTEWPDGGAPEGAPTTCLLVGAPCGVPPGGGLPGRTRLAALPAGRRLCLAAFGDPIGVGCGFPGLATFRPIPGTFLASRRLRRFIRSPRVVTSTAWSEANATGGTGDGVNSRFRRSGHILQVRGLEEKVTILSESVTRVTPRR